MDRGDAFPQDAILKSHPSNSRLTIFWFKILQLNSHRISEYFPHMYIIKLGINLIFKKEKFKSLYYVTSLFLNPQHPKAALAPLRRQWWLSARVQFVQAWVDECLDSWRPGDENLKWSFEGNVSFNGKFSPNLDLKNMISTYTKEFFREKMIQIRLEIWKRKKNQITRFLWNGFFMPQ
jgi:hypothetical protein